MTTKQLIRDFADKLPEDVSFADAIEQLQILESNYQGQADIAAGRAYSHEEVLERLLIDAAIERGQQAAAEGRVVPHAEVRQRFAEWRTK